MKVFRIEVSYDKHGEGIFHHLSVDGQTDLENAQQADLLGHQEFVGSKWRPLNCKLFSCKRTPSAFAVGSAAAGLAFTATASQPISDLVSLNCEWLPIKITGEYSRYSVVETELSHAIDELDIRFLHVTTLIIKSSGSMTKLGVGIACFKDPFNLICTQTLRDRFLDAKLTGLTFEEV